MRHQPIRQKHIGTFPLLPMACILLVLGSVCLRASAQGRLVSEANIKDAVLERTQFETQELDSLNLNRDEALDVADLTLFLSRNFNLVPSVAFTEFTQNANEDDGAVEVHVAFTKAFEQAATISYKVNGTAVHGEDYTLAGLNTTTMIGTFNVEPGATEATITLNVLDDAVFGEGSEVLRFSITGGSRTTYYPGALQTHLLYIDDNDALWTTTCEFPDAGGLEMLSLELTQQDGAFSGRLLADGKLVARPETGDADREGEDGWKIGISSSSNGLRIEIGPIPVDKTVSVFDMHYVRYYVLETYPGAPGYLFDPVRRINGVVTETYVPVLTRLGEVWQDRAYLRRESVGTFSMIRNPLEVAYEEVTLVNN